VTPGCVSASRQCQFLASDKPVFVKFDVSAQAAAEESIGVSFVTASPDGLLFYRQASKAGATHGLLLQLKDRRLVLTVYEDESEPIETTSTGERFFSDNTLHTVYLVKGKNWVRMRADNELVVDSVFLSAFDGREEPVGSSTLHVGGMPGDGKAVGEKLVSNFEGCISQVSEFGKVFIKLEDENIGCKIDRNINYKKYYKKSHKHIIYFYESFFIPWKISK